LAGWGKVLRNILLFSEPKKIEGFILKEDKDEKNSKSNGKKKAGTSSEQSKDKNDSSLLKQAFGGNSGSNQKGDEKSAKKPGISKKLPENLEYIKKIYNFPTNGDIIIREFDITVKGRTINAFLIIIDGMTDRKVVDDDIMQPLMLLANLDIKGDEKDVADFIKNHLLPHDSIKVAKEFEAVLDEVNFGGCALFIDGVDIAFTADVKGFEKRGVERPNTELVIRGPQEGFTENIRTNTALIRKRMKDENLIAENLEIGKRSKTPCAMLYIKDLANSSLVDEVRRRLKSIKVDYISDSGELEQYIEDSTFLLAPQILATERPDRVSTMLADGRVAIILNGSPFALVVPINNTDLIQSPEDLYLRFPYSNLLRIIRIFAVLMSLLLPALYVAITNFHNEMIPTDLLLAIEASREKVPFPSVVEILIMEVAFELIREAGIRIPGPIGPTLGIIGALILGQAAVAANIVSPVLIIVVAVTGIGSFAVPNFSLAFSFRLLRFAYIFLAALAGLLGIATGLFIHGIMMVSAKSFGVPFVVPFAPKTAGGQSDQLMRGPIWKQEKRPDYLNVKDETKQAKISRRWIQEDEKGGNNNEE
jgi:spore germination protein KA